MSFDREKCPVKLPSFDLTDKVAIVTGSTKGLGYGIVMAFAAHGAKVVITSRNGYIYVNTTRPVEIKVFSILGQLIRQEKISAGTFRFRLESKGIYIVKAGTVTRRVTI